MSGVNYILVDDSAAESSAVESHIGFLRHFGHCCFVSCPNVKELVRLRRRYPDAKILGLSEINYDSACKPVKVNPRMNGVRKCMARP